MYLFVYTRFSRFEHVFEWDYTIDTIQCCFIETVNGTDSILCDIRQNIGVLQGTVQGYMG